jgi:hypothetical protein
MAGWIMKGVCVIFLALLLSAILVASLSSQTVKADTSIMQWSKTYGGPNEDVARALVQTSDGGYALAGSTYSFGAGAYDSYLVKTDASGNMMWSKTYGGPNEDVARALVQTSDGGYALAGGTQSFGAGNWDFWLVKTDASGNLQWNRTYGGHKNDAASALVQTGDGGYALAGYKDSFGTDNGYWWLVKTDAVGSAQWNRTYGGPNPGSPSALVETTDGGYALAGSIYSFDAGAYDFWLVKTDASGNLQWSRTYDHTHGSINHNDIATALVQTTDGGYALAGITDLASHKDFWLVKTNTAGSVQWEENYGVQEWSDSLDIIIYNDDQAYALVQTTDGGYALAGYTYSYLSHAWDSYLIKTNATGGSGWGRTYGGTDVEYAYALVQTTDGGYALAGYTESFGTGGHDFWLVKTDVSGIPEFPSPMILAALLVVASSAVILAKRKFRGSPRKPY